MHDSHTHSSFSMDSNALSDDMVERAIELGLDYYAITDHYNRDFDDIIDKYRVHSKELDNPLDLQGHKDDVHRLRAKYGDKIYVGLGLECGYSKESVSAYLDTIDRDKYDVIINSIHTVLHEDIYDLRFYEGKSREYVFKKYLEAIRESVDSPLDYDIIAHIGYMSRKAPYENHIITLDEFGSEIDDILKTIIRRDKCLECNAKTKNTPFTFLPGHDIATRYYELGGRKISYGSDAHSPRRIAEHYDAMARELKGIGFEGFTYFIKGKAHLAKF